MPKEIKDQIDAMLNIGEPSVTDAPFTEAPSATDAPGTEAPGTDVPKTEVPSTDAPGTSAPATDAPTTEAPNENSELEKIKKENEALREQLNKASEKKSASTKAPTTAVPFEEVEFLGNDIDLDELTRDPKMLNKLLNKVFKMGSEASKKFQETTLRNIPDIVKSNVLAQSTLKKKVEDFYTGNKDLKPFKKVVAAVYEEVASENPDWELDKIFKSVEEETRKRLELHKKAGVVTSAPTTNAPKKGPNFPKAKSSRSRQKPNTSRLLSEIDKMNETL